MPSLSGNRHVIIDQREGHYLCFPDVCVTASGRLICAYNDYDQHVATRRSLAVRTSDDGGRTWSEPVQLSANHSHCPRLRVLASGEVQLLDFNGVLVHTSQDQGESWDGPFRTGMDHSHVVADRPLELEDGTLLTTAHSHRGNVALPNLRQAPSEQMVFRSEDGGRTYAPYSVLHFSKHLVLCEGSLCLLPDDRIATLMRENSHVYEPMYLSLSSDQGRTWTEPVPTSLMGHRPTLGVTCSGKLLVTYRDVSPGSGTAAWLGTLEELTAPCPAHGFLDGSGNHSGRWALRPMTDPGAARVTITGRVMATEDGTCRVRLGVWWTIHADHVSCELDTDAEHPEVIRCAIPEGRPMDLRLEYSGGRTTLFIDGEQRASVSVEIHEADSRIMAFSGSVGVGGWEELVQHIHEPRHGHDHHWSWHADQGPPQAAKERMVLELDNSHGAHWSDFGYSGWCEPEPGRFFCAYYHADGSREDYEPNHTAHVRGIRFCEEDFA